MAVPSSLTADMLTLMVLSQLTATIQTRDSILALVNKTFVSFMVHFVSPEKETNT